MLRIQSIVLPMSRGSKEDPAKYENAGRQFYAALKAVYEIPFLEEITSFQDGKLTAGIAGPCPYPLAYGLGSSLERGSVYVMLGKNRQIILYWERKNGELSVRSLHYDCTACTSGGAGPKVVENIPEEAKPVLILRTSGEIEFASDRELSRKLWRFYRW